MISRFTSTVRRALPRRYWSVTLLPNAPRSNCLITSTSRFLPEMLLSAALIILSPITNPAMAAGPFGITLVTCKLSSNMMNSTPIPKKLPFMSSFICCVFFAGIKVEWGSRRASIAITAVSVRSFTLISST